MKMKVGEGEIDTDGAAFCKKCHRRFHKPSDKGTLTIKTNPVTKQPIIKFICGQCIPKNQRVKPKPQKASNPNPTALNGNPEKPQAEAQANPLNG